MPSTPQTSTSQALDSSESLIMLMTVHGTTPKIFFERRPALHGADLHVGGLHPVVDDRAELRHFQQRLLRNAAAWKRISGSNSAFLTRAGSSSFMRAMRPRTSERSSVSTEIPLCFENFFAVAHGVERGGTRANRADAQIAQSLDDAADAGEPFEIFLELRRNSALRCAAS